MNALDIARAACMEVGESTYGISLRGGFLYCNHTEAQWRACLLAEMATHGPGYLTACWRCHPGAFDAAAAACTPVRDALSGLTCERWS